MKKILGLLLLSSNCYAYDITITIPDSEQTRILNAICTDRGFIRLANGRTCEQFVKALIIRTVKQWAISGESSQAFKDAEATARQDAEQDFSITTR